MLINLKYDENFRKSSQIALKVKIVVEIECCISHFSKWLSNPVEQLDSLSTFDKKYI